MKNLINSLEKGKVVSIESYSTINSLRIKMNSLGKRIYQKRREDGSYIASLTSFRTRESTLKQKAVALLTNALATIHPLKQTATENKIRSIIENLNKQLAK